MARESFDVIVVGAGFGGSSCAALLAKRGLKVLLAEKNAMAGGKAMTLSKGGYTHTAWVVIGAPVEGNLYEVVLREVGMQDRATLVHPPGRGSIYRTSSGTYEPMPEMPPGVTDPNVLFDWLEIREQKDRDEALKLFTELTLMPPAERNGLHDITFDDWLARYSVPRSLYAFLVSLCCDGMFMVPVDSLEAAEAIQSLQDMFLRNGGMFCLGGYGRVAEALCEAVRANGGKVLMKTRTEKIRVDRGQVCGIVTDRGGFDAPIVVSNAGIQPTVVKLVGEEHFDKGYANYVKDLVPSWALMGYRYYLDRKVTHDPFGVVFSNESPWSLQRFLDAKKGKASREGVLYYEVPSNYDPDAAPPGKHVLLTGSFAPADPHLSRKEIMAWVDTGEQILFQAFPGIEKAIERKELYTTLHVSRLTRDSVLPGQGGETIGLGQVIGQCGPNKPSVRAPVRGLFYVGCDAGGTGVGTQQAIQSGMKVADEVVRYHRMKQTRP
jgi:phytoene dehydrogenase-like protein